MSSFITTIRVDVEAVKALLPKESHIESVTWNGKELELRWGNGRLATPYTFHVPFSVEQLRRRRLPEKVIIKPGATLPPEYAEGVALPLIKSEHLGETTSAEIKEAYAQFVEKGPLEIETLKVQENIKKDFVEGIREMVNEEIKKIDVPPTPECGHATRPKKGRRA